MICCHEDGFIVLCPGGHSVGVCPEGGSVGCSHEGGSVGNCAESGCVLHYPEILLDVFLNLVWALP